ncbi:hypothetical protein BH11BAC7_BH11BAC7_04910 [soil metagenome]
MSSDNFKDLWNQQSTPAPDVKDFLGKAMQLKKKLRNKIILLNLLLIATAVFITGIVIYFHPQMITTKLGVLLIIIGIVTFLVSNNRISKDLFKKNMDYSTKEYLDQFIRLKQKQEFIQKTMLNLYFILLTTGIILYMYEYASRMTTAGALTTYGVTLAWIALNWFYFRPQAIKKQLSKMNEIIGMLENANRNLEA